MEAQPTPGPDRGATGQTEPKASEQVVEAVAAAEGVSPTDLARPLYYAIDPEALDRLFATPQRGVLGERRVSFPYAGYRVTVRGHDALTVDVVSSRDSSAEE